ncbi:MAG TPA: flagellar biosynthetic protein FliO [Scandinavium sp.]|jgi:flagellar protein FliO/FliZ|uniref:flagellar biosynthetic protein FliO n=1 Tax=Scandinavium sp. TaxID=2830653 RepID=UPI002E3292FE|nr:flagellar biosynthetic protein FliO [Scandinavium sp.]HEX4500807.1 flagellar biosynthetic protein FliO [Scandinavium sp.]
MKPQIAVAHQPITASPASTLVDVSGALLGIILLILAAAWLAKRFGVSGVKSAATKELKVSASTALGQREKVVIVDVEDARLVLGVTASQITLLHKLPPAVIDPNTPKPETPDFASLMKSVIKRPGRD